VKRPIMGVVERKVREADGTQTTVKGQAQIGEELVVERDLGAMISMLTVAIQQLNARLSALEAQ